MIVIESGGNCDSDDAIINIIVVLQSTVARPLVPGQSWETL